MKNSSCYSDYMEFLNERRKQAIDIMLQVALGSPKDDISQTKESTETSSKEFIEVMEYKPLQYSNKANTKPMLHKFQSSAAKENIPESNKKTVEDIERVDEDISAYMRRNVYKAIIRRMLSYIRTNKVEVIEALRSKGFELSIIEDAFHKVKSFNDLEKEKGNPKQSQAILKKIVEKRTPCTYILKETLGKMMSEWGEGKLGRISKGNLRIYREVSVYYYQETIRTLNQTTKPF